MVDLESSGKETLSLLPSLASVAAPQTWEKALSRADLNSFYYSVTDCLYPQLKTHIWKQASLAAWMGRLAHLFSWILGWEYTTVPMVSLLHKVRTKYSSARAYGFIRVHHPKGQSSSSKRPWHRLTDLKSCELQVMLRTGWQETKQIHQLPYILFLRSLMLWWLKKNKPPPPPQTNQPLPLPKPTSLIQVMVCGRRLSHGLILLQKLLKAPDWSVIFWLYLGSPST